MPAGTRTRSWNGAGESSPYWRSNCFQLGPYMYDMVDFQSRDSRRSLNPWGSERGRGGSRPTSRRQNCQAPQSRRPGSSTFPVSISSRRVRLEPSTSGNAGARAAGAGGGPGVAATVGGAASRTVPAAPGETPSPAFPGAAPSCGPAGPGLSGRDWKSPASGPTVESMIMMRRSARNDQETLHSVTLRSPLCAVF